MLKSDSAGIFHVAGPDAVSRHELGVLIAQRDGRDVARLRMGCRADTGLSGALDMRLDSSATQQRLHLRVR
ncbi:hypothetical protein GCM10027073_32070 [Streptomyces chlorus]